MADPKVYIPFPTTSLYDEVEVKRQERYAIEQRVEDEIRTLRIQLKAQYGFDLADSQMRAAEEAAKLDHAAKIREVLAEAKNGKYGCGKLVVVLDYNGRFIKLARVVETRERYGYGTWDDFRHGKVDERKILNEARLDEEIRQRYSLDCELRNSLFTSKLDTIQTAPNNGCRLFRPGSP